MQGLFIAVELIGIVGIMNSLTGTVAGGHHIAN